MAPGFGVWVVGRRTTLAERLLQHFWRGRPKFRAAYSTEYKLCIATRICVDGDARKVIRWRSTLGRCDVNGTRGQADDSDLREGAADEVGCLGKGIESGDHDSGSSGHNHPCSHSLHWRARHGR